MKTIVLLLNPVFFLIAFIPSLIFSFFLLKKNVFNSTIKTYKQFIAKILLTLFIEFLITIMSIIPTILLVIIGGLGGALLSVIIILETLVSCSIISLVTTGILWVEYKNKRDIVRRKLTKTNLLITVLILLIIGLLISIIYSFFI